MEKQVKLRIRQALSEVGTNPTQLSKRFGVNQKTLNSQINGETTLSASTILLVLEAIPDLSAEWLLRGTGSMMVGEGITPEQLFKKLGLPGDTEKIIEIWMKFMSIMENMQEIYKKSI